MRREILYSALHKMFIKLNRLIEQHNFDLLDSEVQKYSRKLDRLITKYNKTSNKNNPIRS